MKQKLNHVFSSVSTSKKMFRLDMLYYKYKNYINIKILHKRWQCFKLIPLKSNTKGLTVLKLYKKNETRKYTRYHFDTARKMCTVRDKVKSSTGESGEGKGKAHSEGEGCGHALCEIAQTNLFVCINLIRCDCWRVKICIEIC